MEDLTTHRVLLAHPGTQYSYQLARQLARRKLLYEFWTGFALPSRSRVTAAIRNMAPRNLSRKVANRILPDVPKKFIRTTPMVELRALRRISRGSPEQEVFLERNRIFQEK